MLLTQSENSQCFNYKYYMREEHTSQHKIIPVKSLLEKEKQIKRQFQTFVPRESNHPHPEFMVTPKAYPYHNTDRLGLPLREHPVTANQPSSRQHLKGISVGKKVSLSKASFNQYQKQTFAQSPPLQFEEYYALKLDPKPYQHAKQHFEFDKNINAAYETERKSQNYSANQQLAAKLRTQKKDSSKYGYSNGLSQQMQRKVSKTGDKNATKYEQQVWNISTEKSTFIEKRQSHSIFKDDLSRIKTDLFQKEANLIEKNKELERRDSQIREIAGQLQANVAVSDALKKRIEGLVEEVRGNCEINQRLLREKEQSEKMGEEKCRKMQEELKSKEQTIANLRNSQCKNNQQYQRSLEDYQTNIKLLTLKVRQLECEERERNLVISNLKQTEKRCVEIYKSKMDELSEIVQQKQQQLADLKTAVMVHQSEQSKIQSQRQRQKQDYASDLTKKEQAIRELSQEVSDLKGNLRTVEVRMRELIENEEQLRKQIEKKRNLKDRGNDRKEEELQAALNVLAKELEAKSKEISLKDNQMKQLLREAEDLKRGINEQIDLKNQYISESNERLKKIRELQALKHARTLEEKDAKKVVQGRNEGERNSQGTKVSKERMKEHLMAVQDELNECRQRLAEKQMEISQQQPRLAIISKERQLNLLKPRFCKVVSQNQRLNITIKQLNYKLQQFYNTNCDLNSEIIEKDLVALNKRMMEK